MNGADEHLIDALVEHVTESVGNYADDAVAVLDAVIYRLRERMRGQAAEDAPTVYSVCANGYQVELMDGDWMHSADAAWACDTAEPDQEQIEEVRADQIERGDVFQEDGMDEWHHVVVDPDGEGDTIVLTNSEGRTVYLDRDTVVERLIR